MHMHLHLHVPKVLKPICWWHFVEDHPLPEPDHTCPWCGETFPVFCRPTHHDEEAREEHSTAVSSAPE